MPKYAITEVVARFERDLVAAVIDHVTELLVPLGPRAPVDAPAPAPAVSAPAPVPTPPAVKPNQIPAADRIAAADRVVAAVLKTFTGKPTNKPTRQPGEKRDRKAIAALAETLATYIAKHPGQRVEQINAGLNLTTPEVASPLRRLIKVGRVRTTGKLRATRYFPAAAKAGGEAKAKKGKPAA